MGRCAWLRRRRRTTRDSARLAEPADPEAPATPRRVRETARAWRAATSRGSLLQKIRGANEEYDERAPPRERPPGALHRDAAHRRFTSSSRAFRGARGPRLSGAGAIWQHKTFGRLPAQDRLRQYELLVGEVLPPFLGEPPRRRHVHRVDGRRDRRQSSSRGVTSSWTWCSESCSTARRSPAPCCPVGWSRRIARLDTALALLDWPLADAAWSSASKIRKR